MAVLFAVSIGHAQAQTAENFNSRAGIAINQVKSHLQNACWQFPDMDVNRTGWNAAIEGDGAMVSGQSSNSSQNTGIISPVLQVGTNLTVAFKYKFNNQVNHRRWLLITLTDADNQPVQRLDSLEVTGLDKNDVYTFNRSFNTPSGPYKIYIQYKGINGNTRIAIDELMISASRRYLNGCNESPVIVSDSLTGTAGRTAFGNVLNNDHDPEQEGIEVSLETPSPDGEVSLDAQGNFTFKPNADFKGSQTSFRYSACDKGHSPKCGSGSVTINFPAAAVLPVVLTEFSAQYQRGQVNVRWSTSYEINHSRFELERSTNGRDYTTLTTIYGNGNSNLVKKYAFPDALKNVPTQRKDLYYRLRQIDLDGKQTVSKVVVVRLYDNPSIQLVSVSPNPVINNIGVQVELNEEAMVSMRVSNQQGVEIYNQIVKGIAGSNRFELAGSQQFKPGLYFLEVVINAKERMVLKLIKQ